MGAGAALRGRAALAFDRVASRYTGEVNISPLYVNAMRVDVRLPVTLEKDRAALTNALLRTPKSRIAITGALEHLASPRTSARYSSTSSVGRT